MGSVTSQVGAHPRSQLRGRTGIPCCQEPPGYGLILRHLVGLVRRLVLFPWAGLWAVMGVHPGHVDGLGSPLHTDKREWTDYDIYGMYILGLHARAVATKQKAPKASQESSSLANVLSSLEDRHG